MKFRIPWLIRFCIVSLVSLLMVQESGAQVALYSFYQTQETYTMGSPAGTPATAFPVLFDDEAAIYVNPFTFSYNGVTYPATTGRIGISANGWVAFGANSGFTMTGPGAGGSYITGTHNGSYLSGSSTNNGVAGFNGNLAEQSFTPFTCTVTSGSSTLSDIPASGFANIQVGTRLDGPGIPNGTVVLGYSAFDGLLTMSTTATASATNVSVIPRSSIYAFISGSAPYQKLYIQFTQLRRAGMTGDNFSFQIIVNEGGGIATEQNIQVRYGNCIVTGTSFEVQAGLRGAAATDFNARKTITDWSATAAATANTDRLLESTSVFPVKGTVFNWTKGVIPANDNCSGAFTITSAGTCINTAGTTVNSNQQFAPTSCGGFTSTFANEVWYKFSANGASFYNISVTGTNGFDPVLALYASGCTTGNFISCVDATINDGIETINAGVLPAGTYYYRIYGWNGSTGTFNTCVVGGTPCAAPTASPTNLVLTPSTSSMAGSFTASSPASSGYLVIRTNTATPPSNPVNGTTYVAGTSALGGFVESFGNATTFNSTGLEVLTNYCYWVFGYNTTACVGGPVYRTNYLTGCNTTLNCSGTSTKTWANTGVGGDFHTASNWTPAGVPNACNDVVINLTTTATISLSANTTINSLTFKTSGNGAAKTGTLDVGVFNLTVKNATNIDATNGNGNAYNQSVVGSTTSGIIDFKGNVTLGTTAASTGPTTSAASGINGTSATRYIFRGNLTFGPTAFISTTPPGTAEFDGTGSQTITWNNGTFYANFNNVIIGNQNSPTVNQVTGTVPPDNIKGNLVINNNSILNLGTSQWNRNTNGGVFLLNNSATLKLGGSSSAAITGTSPGGVNVTGNNFPAWFATYTLSPTSTVEYNSANGINQIIAPVLNVPASVYGNLILTNATGSGTSTKSLSQNLNGIAGNITINPFAVFDIAAFTANRTAPGGIFTIASNGKFRLSGSSGGVGPNNNFPNNFSTFSFNAAGTTEYYGGNQGIYSVPDYGHLTIMNAGTKTAPAGDLTIKGNFANTGSTFAHNNGRVLINGTGAQSFAGVNYYNLLLSNGGTKSTSGQVSITDSLKLNTSTVLSISANDTITLLSTNAKTASIGIIPAGATIQYGSNAKFRVERYVPNHSKAWQLMAVPTIGQTVKAAWQEGAATPNANPKPGYGTQLASALPNAISLGFDVLAFGNSPKTYNPVTADWDGIASTSIGIYNKKGYMLFVRGDRSVTASAQAPTATTLRTTGTIYDAVTLPPSTTVNAGKFESIGNPYASAINFDNVTLSGGIPRNFYVWDPKLTSNGVSYFGLGGFQTFASNYPNPGYTIIPGQGSYASGNTNIESGIAFLVNAPFSSGTISFSENAKTTGSNTVTRNAGEEISSIKVNLFADANNDPVLIDGVLSQFDDIYSNEVDLSDAMKIKNNGGEALSIARGGNILVLERRSSIRFMDTIFYHTAQLRRNQPYHFLFQPTNLNTPGLKAYLEDSYLGSKTPVNLTEETRIDFKVDDNPSSQVPDRFRLFFLPSSALPVSFTYITAERKSLKTVKVRWGVESEINVSRYVLESGANGAVFQDINETNAANNGSSMQYEITDHEANSGACYYRIKAVLSDGNKKLSATARVSGEKDQPGIQVFPNPVVDGTLRISFVKLPTGNYSVQILDMQGKTVFQKSLFVSQNESGSLLFENMKQAGSYSVVIANNQGLRFVEKVLVL